MKNTDDGNIGNSIFVHIVIYVLQKIISWIYKVHLQINKKNERINRKLSK